MNFSSNLKFGKDTIGRFMVVYGAGIQNYMNDAPIDIGVKNNFSNPASPIIGVALPLLGVVSFLDHNWSDRFSTSIGYSMENIENSDAAESRQTFIRVTMPSRICCITQFRASRSEVSFSLADGSTSEMASM